MVKTKFYSMSPVYIVVEKLVICSLAHRDTVLISSMYHFGIAQTLTLIESFVEAAAPCTKEKNAYKSAREYI